MKTLYLLIALAAPALAWASDDFETQQPFFNEHCVQCHGPQKQKGDVRLDDLSVVDIALWNDVYEQLASEAMPPDDQPQPSRNERRAVLKSVLKIAKAGSSVTSTGFRRLNRREYGNTVRDLLGLRKGTFDPSEYVYVDEVDEGFDTNAESLVVSNELLLEYMGAAEKSLRRSLFSADRERPSTRAIDVNLRKMTGTSSRYMNTHADYAITRSGGKAQLYDGEASRTMTTPGRYTITVTASAVDRDRYPERLKPNAGPVIMGFGVEQDCARKCVRRRPAAENV